MISCQCGHTGTFEDFPVDVFGFQRCQACKVCKVGFRIIPANTRTPDGRTIFSKRLEIMTPDGIIQQP